jgi:hypothetical protein
MMTAAKTGSVLEIMRNNQVGLLLQKDPYFRFDHSIITVVKFWQRKKQT